MTDDPGFRTFAATSATLGWVEAAGKAAARVDMSERRHGGTWFVGLDALPNAVDGSVDGVALDGPWRDHIVPPAGWHPAQLSVVWPGYPGRDPDETEAAHRFRQRRDAAHLDGLLAEGPARRRFLREPHAFILGIALDDVEASPLVVWPGSHRMIGRVFRRAFDGLDPQDWADIDVTDIYQATRKAVFADCPRVPVALRRGESVLLHRMLIHGVAPWEGEAHAPRRIAYFRPLTDPASWLSAD